MMKQLFILLAIVSRMLVINCYVEDGYNRLNEHLIKTVATDDLDENLAEIRKENDRVTSVTENPNYVRAIRDLCVCGYAAAKTLQLGDDDDDDQYSEECGQFDYYFMKGAAMRTKAHKHFANPNAELNRVNLIFYKIFMKHAERCKNVWPEKFKNIFPLIKGDVLYTSATEWQKEILTQKKSSPMTNREYMELLIDQKPLSSDNYDAYVAQAALFIKNQALASTEQDYEALYEKFIHEPCTEFTETIGEELLKNVTFDAQMYPGHEGYVLEGDEENLINLYLAIAFDKTCSALENNGQFKAAVVEKLIKSSQ